MFNRNFYYSGEGRRGEQGGCRSAQFMCWGGGEKVRVSTQQREVGHRFVYWRFSCNWKTYRAFLALGLNSGSAHKLRNNFSKTPSSVWPIIILLLLIKENEDLRAVSPRPTPPPHISQAGDQRHTGSLVLIIIIISAQRKRQRQRSEAHRVTCTHHHHHHH